MLTLTSINVRVDDELKEKSREVFDDLGLDLSTGIKIYLKQVVLRQGIPFDVTLEKSDIESALEDIEAGRIETFNDVDELLEELEDED